MAANTGPKQGSFKAIRSRRGQFALAAAVVASALIFLADALSPIDGAVAVLYTGVVLTLAPLGRRFVIGSGCVTAVLTTIAFLIGHADDPLGGAHLRYAVSLVAIAITVLLSLRDRSARTTLAEQARILELSHDTVVVRDRSDIIRYWNEGAERLYGWTRGEALGRRCSDLLEPIVSAEEVNASLEQNGTWSGEIIRTRRDGTRLILASRWLERRDPDGRPVGIIETSADLTESRRALAERRSSEQRYSTIFNSAGFAALECDLSKAMRLILDSKAPDQDCKSWLLSNPQISRAAANEIGIYNANSAALAMFEADTVADLADSNVMLGQLPDSEPALAHIFALLAAGSSLAEIETRCATLHGRIIDAVLRVSVLPDGQDWSRVLLMAFDVTERNEARAKIEQTSVELAHSGRVALLGQLAGSIVHEVNQPLAAIINYGKSGKRWLTRPDPNLTEVSDCLDKIVSNGNRAAEVVGRVRALAKKTAPQVSSVDMGALVQDAVSLLARETRAAAATIRVEEANIGGPIICDRVQVQQVIVNLLMNALHATRGIADRPHEIRVKIDGTAENFIKVAVEDSGTGIEGNPERIFEPFFTTKSDGMGLGLSICRTIIEGQGGRVSASNNDGWGATVGFTLPLNIPAEARWSKPNILI
ncbi:ATP-binding protein [Bradyrhizobium sp. Arg237L]|uniref:PAS domain-containing sensor histidine kinase n=1 Tax=Bradyrhizobium sp. Arg237L TaxID=3003352 RepID=UPI00249E096E|nr:PAS domain-containing sensor histidine kinase [Bradyrhizobium sp. Arg237L]MDI4237682.1 ATP-binding protein [Bradyrhizobium sp. Arg237L]